MKPEKNIRSYTIRDLPVREHPRERLRHLGAQALSTAELLAITLRTGTAEQNALQLAQQLLVVFDGLPGLAMASLTELTSLSGIGPAKATEIKASFELGRRLLQNVVMAERPKITTPAAVADLLMSEMSLLEQEELRTVILDTRSQVLEVPTIYKGTVGKPVLRIAEVFKPAIRANAAALIVAHNHVAADAVPSPEDVAITRDMVTTGRLLGIEVLDHLLIGQRNYVSFRERGLGFDLS